MSQDNYFKSAVCLNSFNSGCFFEIYIFSTTTDFFALSIQMSVSREAVVMRIRKRLFFAISMIS